MATDQKKLAVYVPATVADEFETLVKSQGKTVTGAIRVMIRDYLAANAESTQGHMMETGGTA